jgi:nuclear transcription factor Y alpha
MFKLVDKVKRKRNLFSRHFYVLVLQLSNLQTAQQPQTITIPAGALQLGGNGQQIVQLSTPTKMQTSSQNGSVIMVKFDFLFNSFFSDSIGFQMVPGNSGQLQTVQMQTAGTTTTQNQTGVAPEPTEEEPLYVNAKQYNRILKRRAARAKLEAEGRIPRERKVCKEYFS